MVVFQIHAFISFLFYVPFRARVSNRGQCMKKKIDKIPRKNIQKRFIFIRKTFVWSRWHQHIFFLFFVIVTVFVGVLVVVVVFALPLNSCVSLLFQVLIFIAIEYLQKRFCKSEKKHCGNLLLFLFYLFLFRKIFKNDIGDYFCVSYELFF